MSWAQVPGVLVTEDGACTPLVWSDVGANPLLPPKASIFKARFWNVSAGRGPDSAVAPVYLLWGLRPEEKAGLPWDSRSVAHRLQALSSVPQWREVPSTLDGGVLRPGLGGGEAVVM